MRVGIVGLPNAGKSTLFNALTQAGAETGEYPFTTVEPNVAVVPVPDERLAAVAEVTGAAPLIAETVEFRDIAGLVRGASAGEGLGNRFLAEIRETDAICHLVRAHGDERVPHPEGEIDPARDLATVDTELVHADIEQAERRLERVVKQARSGDESAAAEREWLQRVLEALRRGEPARIVPLPESAAGADASLQALTSKPVLYVANVDEDDSDVPAEVATHAVERDAGAVAISARVESELAEMEPADAIEMRQELGLGAPGLERLIRAAYDLLSLITFFTAHPGSEGRARALRRGSTALDAAASVHTDIARGFVRAEVIGWRELVEAGGYPEARALGTLRTEGRDYVIADGDVVTVKH